MRYALVGALLSLVDATFFLMPTSVPSGAGPVCCCGCESNSCLPQAPTCPPPQNPCPQTSYWFGQQYRQCNNGVAWRQPYSEYFSSGGLQPSYNSNPPGFSPSSSFQQNFDTNNNYLYPGVASPSPPLYPPIVDTYPSSVPSPASPSVLPPSYPPSVSVDSPAPAPAPEQVEPASLKQNAEILVENEQEPYEQQDNPTADRSPQVIPILKSIQITPTPSPPPSQANSSDYESEYVDIDALPKLAIDHESNKIDPSVLKVDSDLTTSTTTTTSTSTSTSTTTSVPPKKAKKTGKSREADKKLNLAPPKNKTVDPEMMRIGRVLGEIETMLELVKKEMAVDIYDDEAPRLNTIDDEEPRKLLFAEYETDFASILDKEDKDPSTSTTTTVLPAEVEPKPKEIPTRKNSTSMQEIIESLKMEHLRAERRRKFLETLEARALADQRLGRQKRDTVSESGNLDIHSLTQSQHGISSNDSTMEMAQEKPTDRRTGEVGSGVDIHCNSDDLKEVINKELSQVFDSSVAKRKIQKAAESKLGGIFNVICSNSEFSFLINSALYCESGNGKVACFAFLEPDSA